MHSYFWALHVMLAWILYSALCAPPHIPVLQLLLIAAVATIFVCVWLLLTWLLLHSYIALLLSHFWQIICMYKVVLLCSSSVSGSVGVQLCVSQCQPLMLSVGVLTSSSLWVNVSSNQQECWQVAPCGSISVPGSVDMQLLVRQCQLPNQCECWHAASCRSMSALQSAVEYVAWFSWLKIVTSSKPFYIVLQDKFVKNNCSLFHLAAISGIECLNVAGCFIKPIAPSAFQLFSSS